MLRRQRSRHRAIVLRRDAEVRRLREQARQGHHETVSLRPLLTSGRGAQERRTGVRHGLWPRCGCCVGRSSEDRGGDQSLTGWHAGKQDGVLAHVTEKAWHPTCRVAAAGTEA